MTEQNGKERIDEILDCTGCLHKSMALKAIRAERDAAIAKEKDTAKWLGALKEVVRSDGYDGSVLCQMFMAVCEDAKQSPGYKTLEINLVQAESTLSALRLELEREKESSARYAKASGFHADKWEKTMEERDTLREKLAEAEKQTVWEREEVERVNKAWNTCAEKLEQAESTISALRLELAEATIRIDAMNMSGVREIPSARALLERAEKAERDHDALKAKLAEAEKMSAYRLEEIKRLMFGNPRDQIVTVYGVPLEHYADFLMALEARSSEKADEVLAKLAASEKAREELVGRVREAHRLLGYCDPAQAYEVLSAILPANDGKAGAQDSRVACLKTNEKPTSPDGRRTA